MAVVSSHPNCVKVDQTIKFSLLQEQSLKWIEKAGFPIRRSFAPFHVDYVRLFGKKEFLYNQEKTGSFYGMLTHCLLLDVQLHIAAQYFHGMNLLSLRIPLSWFSNFFPGLSDVNPDERRLFDLNHITMNELYGRFFFEYTVIMVRAQWDKFIRLCCYFFGLRANWDSSDDGLNALIMLCRSNSSLHSLVSYHMEIFVAIAKQRLHARGWLQQVRNHLLHFEGRHSLGVLPQKKSVDTTTDLWNSARNELNHLHEAMAAMFIALLASRIRPK